ncbi:hypothetical protein N781_01085 [Pontibacillus halophilus JSM 076056 = DSM 19796]|uniref:Acyltransferase 3 domain-containing protein n=1 Tax=Pontibacillus halophilus JSM 076056 = DSM 19796 TaxID=1385510 RepID=A0A0A5GPA7_9BACI|nr:acyltransferase family protein [Pontibacillus halophilus]KGX93824.1 hypothetical protein N781_01085 [Pontibacillus halophilus JSM 076056 = DSM 19796]
MNREAYFDNAKYLLIFFVVFGHIIQPFTSESDMLYVLYQWIYMFHMPAFIFISGHFAKVLQTKREWKSLAKKLLVPYLMFQLLYSLYYYGIGKEDWMHHVFEPHWALWFLLSLFSWHILLVWFHRFPRWMALFVAVQVGIIVGYMEPIGHMFSLSRTFVFFPFFLAGYYSKGFVTSFVKRKEVKAGGFLVMLIALITLTFVPQFGADWWFGSKSYVELGLPQLGGVARTLIYVASFIMVGSVLAWVPTRDMKWSSYGANTLPVYLLHGFVIQYMRENPLLDEMTALNFFAIFLLATGLTFVLSTPWMAQVFKQIIQFPFYLYHYWTRRHPASI